jgi:uncharacterized metal-binding protein
VKTRQQLRKLDDALVILRHYGIKHNRPDDIEPEDMLEARELAHRLGKWLDKQDPDSIPRIDRR